MSLPFAENMPYWKTSQSGVETWLDKVEKMIVEMGGQVDTRLAGKQRGREAILFEFTVQNDIYKILYPVLPTKKDKDKNAALRQCATLIYHDVKSRLNRIKIFGIRVVFSDYLVLDNGQTLSQIGNDYSIADIKQIQK
ncbi:hypothetical protein WAF17_02655 [Bernardetia sp. ABR2-2B]|uniref:hypothetical protein n=1 Tax=Bernardetia sp. ABR2-2B TaxID=3127472 RepID=UPI0030CC982F